MQNISNDKNDENDLFILQNKLLFKKFHPIKPIGKGTFSTVYLCINIKNDSYVVIKAEKRSKNVRIRQRKILIQRKRRKM